MDFSLPSDLWSSVIPISLLVGAAGGLAWDIGNAVRPSKKEPATGIDNTVEFPRIYRKKGGGHAMDLGFFGPMLVGAVAGVLLVLLVGPTAPSAEEAAKALVTVGTVSSAPQPAANGAGQGQGGQGATAGAESEVATPAEATETVEEQLPPTIPEAQLVLLALLGGLAGWGLLQTLTTKMSGVFEAAVGNSVKAAGEAAEAKVLQEAGRLGVADDSKKEELAELAGAAATEAGSAALEQEVVTGSGS